MVILELVRAKNAPAALVQMEVDPLLVSGPVICLKLQMLSNLFLDYQMLNWKNLSLLLKP